MAEGKRYFWLRLHDDFFRSVRIKKLRRMAGGDTYVIIYLKMQLKAMKTDGILTWRGYEQDFVDELAIDLDEEPDNVRVTLAYLLSCGLAETEDKVNFFLPYAVENTGSEGASAQRVREFRARKEAAIPKQLPKANAERQRAFRAKQSCEQKQHIPFIEDHANKKRYGGNYYIVCQRDHFRCAICDSIENLCVHHIDGFDETKPENNAENRMVLLCRSCHANVHAGTPIPQDVLDAIGYDRNENNVTCNAPVTQAKQIGNGDIEIEKEKEKETEIDTEKKKSASRFTPPTIEEVRAYCTERGNSVDADRFHSYYTSNGWKVGKNSMKDWRAAVRTWEKDDRKPTPKKPGLPKTVGPLKGGDDLDKLMRRYGLE
jgi:predicted phage replisome organizer